MNWLLISLNISLLTPNALPQEALHAIAACPAPYQLPLLAIIAVESDYRPNARSSTGDVGLAQLNASLWARTDKETLNLADPRVNILRACEILDRTYQARRSHSKLAPGEWASFYHSKTKSIRQAYWKKVQSKLEILKYASKEECKWTTSLIR